MNINDFNFTSYVPGRSRLAENSISITKNHVNLSDNLMNKVRNDVVELRYDSEHKVMCINFDVESNGMKCRGGKIGAKGFFKYFNIDKAGSFKGEFFESKNCLIIKIGE